MFTGYFSIEDMFAGYFSIEMERDRFKSDNLLDLWRVFLLCYPEFANNPSSFISTATTFVSEFIRYEGAGGDAHRHLNDKLTKSNSFQTTLHRFGPDKNTPQKYALQFTATSDLEAISVYGNSLTPMICRFADYIDEELQTNDMYFIDTMYLPVKKDSQTVTWEPLLQDINLSSLWMKFYAERGAAWGQARYYKYVSDKKFGPYYLEGPADPHEPCVLVPRFFEYSFNEYIRQDDIFRIRYVPGSVKKYRSLYAPFQESSHE